MGINPIPTVFGANCNTCWAPGATPKLLKMFFSGIIKSPFWLPTNIPYPNGYYDAVQDPGQPCLFGGGNPEAVHWSVTFGIGTTSVWLAYAVFTTYFRSIPAIPCVMHHTNSWTDPFLHRYYDGWCFICTPAQMQSWVELVTPVVGPEPKMDLFSMSNKEVVLRFANVQAGTNINLKIDTTAL